MKPPIIVSEHGDIEFYASTEDAELDLEATDVRNGEYIAYDSEGRLLHLAIRQKKRRWTMPVEVVAITESEEVPTHDDELREALVDFFSRLGVDEEWLGRATLNELVAKGIADFNAR